MRAANISAVYTKPQARQMSQALKAFATIDPKHLSTKDKGFNLVGGSWTGTASYLDLVDPMTGKPMIKLPDTSMEETLPFIESMKAVPKTGLHNPFKNKERYLMLGEVNRKIVDTMSDPEVFDFFVNCIQRCAPKSRPQTAAEL